MSRANNVITWNSRFIPVGLAALSVLWTVHFAAKHVARPGSITGHTVVSQQGPSALVRSLRPSYPYSVIAGGAYSPVELRFAGVKDAVVRAHYADFDMEHARVVRLADDRFQYVSYRIKDQVYWTKAKLRIPSGELLLTDGVRYARARCGNRLSDVPQKSAQSEKEPAASLLSLPPVEPNLLPTMALANPPESSPIPPNMHIAVGGEPLLISPWPAAVTPTPGEPFIPLAPVWGGQPVVGPLVVAPPAERAHPLIPSSPSSPIIPNVPPVLTNPSQPLPGNITPVPEPSTVPLVVLTLLFGGWALLPAVRKRAINPR